MRSLCSIFLGVIHACVINVSDSTITSANLSTYLRSLACLPINTDTVYIDRLSLPTISSTTFNGFSNLKHLTITNCGLTAVPVGLFDGLPLIDLTLANNALSWLPANVFPVSMPLELLDVSSNNLTGFLGGTFDNLGGLKYLFLDNNNLRSSEIHTHLLDSCTLLTEVRLQDNPSLLTLPTLLFNPTGDLLGTMTLTADSSLLCSSCPVGCSYCRSLLSTCCYHTTAPTASPTTSKPTTLVPTTRVPTLAPSPPTSSPTSRSPTSISPTTHPSTYSPTLSPVSDSPTRSPSTLSPSTGPTLFPTTRLPTFSPTTLSPSNKVSPTSLSLPPTPTAISNSSAPTLTLGATSDTSFPWVYFMAAAGGALLLLAVVIYLRQRQKVKKARAAYLRGITTEPWSSGDLNMHDSHSPQGSHSPKASFAQNAMSAAIWSSHSEGDSSVSRKETGDVMSRDRMHEGDLHARGGTMVEIDGKEVEVGAKLGNGAFGSVHQCLWRGTDYAMKRLLNPSQESAFEKEVEINRVLSAMPHIHVTRMVGVTENPTGIVMELYPMGSVEDYLRSNPLTSADFPHLLTILITASAGVMHLHSQRIIHRDLAARNFLIKKDHSVALCDFGLALGLPEGRAVGSRTLFERSTDLLPINITAPETLSQGLYSPASDVYMFGMFMWEVIARQIPHSDRVEFASNPKNFSGFIDRVVKEDLRPVVPLEWPLGLRALVVQCWNRNPSLRPSLQQINSTLRIIRAEALVSAAPLPPSLAKVSSIAENSLYSAQSSPRQGEAPMAYGSGELYGQAS